MPVSNSRFSAAELALLFIVVVWALNFSVVKYSLAEIDPLSFNAMRFAAAIALMWVVVWFRRLRIVVHKGDWGRLVLLAVLGNLAYQMLFIIGIDLTQASNAAVMLGMIPVWTALLSHLFTSEKMFRLQAIGVIAAFGGVALIMGGAEGGWKLSGETLAGDLIIVTAALVFAMYTLLARSMLRTYTPLTLATLVMTLGGTMLIIVGIPSLVKLDYSLVGTASYAGAAFSGLFAIGAAYLIWNFGIKNVGAVKTSTYQNLVPVLGVLFGVTFLGESLHFLQYLGTIMTVGGIMLARYTANAPRQAATVR